MKIDSGLFDHMVLQRNRRNVSDAEFAGAADADGVVTARVTCRGGAVRGFAGVRVGAARRGRFACRLKGLPVGGPYDIELRLAGAAACLQVRDVLVGDVWLLGGQSNMEGIGWLQDALKPDPLVRACYMDDRWDVAKDPIHNIGQAVDEVHRLIHGGQLPQRSKHVGVGPGTSFGQDMRRRTGVPQGLICCAHGGTSMTQWDPARRDEGTRSLYGAMVRRIRKYGGRAVGLLWYQGESDADEAASACFLARMKAFVRAVRRDLGDARLPFVMVQIGCVVGERNYGPWNRIQDLQRRLQDLLPCCATVPSVDLPLDDGIHISGAGQNRLGRRLAQSMSVLRGDRGAGKPPMAIGSIEVKPDPVTVQSNVFIKFRNVMGTLRAPGLPAGFALTTPSPTDSIYRVDLRGDTVVLRTLLSREALSMFVQYGLGNHPHCNVTDSADRSLPVFGPVAVGRPQAITAYVNRLDVSRALPSAGRLQRVGYPLDVSSLEFRPRQFSGYFCDLHLDLFASAPEDRMVFFRHTFTCAEPMRLQVNLGYDGPVKLWIDGTRKFQDPAGTNPAIPDAVRVPFQASPGRHEILVALGSNSGKAWGIFLRFLRRDVPARLLAAGPGAYRMPEPA